MSWITPRLRERVQIRKAVQTPNDVGGFDRSYEKLVTIWAGINPVTYKHSSLKYIRNVQISDDITHSFIIRWSSLVSITAEFGTGFVRTFDSIVDILSLKSDYFIFMEQGVNSGIDWEGPFSKAYNTTFDVYYGIEQAKGRLFKILGAGRVDERKEYVKVAVSELEEMGSGFSL